MKSSASFKPAIVIPAFNRAGSLRRLLDSVNEASYPFDDITVVISADGGADKGVIDTAKNFTFHAGRTEVICHEENLGLRSHILRCADLAGKYGSVIILEDDLVVSPAFYRFAVNALEFYDADPRIAGISLYAPRFNETAQLPFEPSISGLPVYFMQLGSSWGQAWTKNQWIEFRKWYSHHDEGVFDGKPQLPENIRKWPGSSWKKYFNLYLIQEKKYLMYPFHSYSTHTSCGEGVHIKKSGSLFQVPLHQGGSPLGVIEFPDFEESPVRYDAFMEAEGREVESGSGFSGDEMELDLYGSKPLELIRQKKYCITSKNGEQPIRTYPLAFRPLELNLKFEITGNEEPFFGLYSTGSITEETLSAEKYFRMAEYFSYFNFKTKKFSSGLFLEWIKKTIKPGN